MPTRTFYLPLTDNDCEALVPVLHREDVFAHIGGLPTKDDFTLGLRRAIAGPPATCVKEHWINYAARLTETGELIGRVEATVHDDLAEVAFLYNPSFWGRGYATEGLEWLHDHLLQYKEVTCLWATTHPKNERSAALLLKAGYVPASISGLPLLYSYDEGDFAFQRSVA